METAETQTTMERKKLFLKPLLESQLLISHWLRQVTWINQNQRAGKQAQPLEGRSCKATGPRAGTQEGLKNRKEELFKGLAALH